MTQAEIKKALQLWDNRYSQVENASTVDASETTAQQLARIRRLRSDYAGFVEYYFPHWCADRKTGKVTPMAKFHLDAARKIRDNENFTGIFMWARGHAKSTHMNLFIPLWLKCQERRTINVFVIVSANETSALSWAANLQAELQFNQRYIADFGQQTCVGKWEIGNFQTADGFSCIALGRGQKPRGLNKRGFRPDYIVCDDLDDDELCLNEDRVKKTAKWVQEALYGTFGARGGRFIMVGNLISNQSVLANIAAIDGVYITRVNVRDKNGRPSWPDLWTEESIRQREAFMSYASFQKEYMNNPINEGAVFTEMHFEKCPPLKKFPFLVCYGDPSPSNNRNAANSMKAVWLIGMLDGRYYVLDGRVRRATNAEFVDWFYDVNAAVPEGVQVYNLIENNTLQDPFYQQVFIPLFMEKAKEGKDINIAPDDRKKPDKFSRIEGNLEPLNRQGRLILNADRKDSEHFKRLEEQFLLLTPRLSAPADGADCIEGGVWWLQQKTAILAAGAMTLSARRINDKRI